MKEPKDPGEDFGIGEFYPDREDQTFENPSKIDKGRIQKHLHNSLYNHYVHGSQLPLVYKSFAPQENWDFINGYESPNGPIKTHRYNSLFDDYDEKQLPTAYQSFTPEENKDFIRYYNQGLEKQRIKEMEEQERKYRIRWYEDGSSRM